jgi:agmatinase
MAVAIDGMIPPEKTSARIAYGAPPGGVSFESARIVVYGVPFDDTATFGKGTSRGPEGLRHVSARQIETFVVDEGMDLFESVGVFDLGDLPIRVKLTDGERTLLQSEESSDLRARALRKLDQVMKQFERLADLTRELRERGKIPVMLGGEHTLSYWPLSALAPEKPVVLHFDAHRDAKASYMGMKMSHTTPMYRYLKEHGRGEDFVQIGIRQTDSVENEFCIKAGVKTFYPRDVREEFSKVAAWIRKKTQGRGVYVSFDIDALDISYTPCTGTPEPFGLTPQEAVGIFKAVHPSAKLVGADMMEVGVRNGDYREATTAAQLLNRLFCRRWK